jgi:hypothetical protein
VKVGEEHACPREEDVVPTARRFVPQGLGEVTLADSRRPQDPHPLGATDEGAGREVVDLLTVDCGVELEVESLEGLCGIEPGSPQPQSELLLISPFDLVLKEPLEEFDVSAFFLNGLVVAHIEGFKDSGEPKTFQFG